MREPSLERAARRGLAVAMLMVASFSGSALAQDGPTTGRIGPISPPGKLKVRQRKGEAFAEATFGMIVRRGYRLDLEAGARASVRCSDGKLYELIPGPQGCPCVTPEEGTIQDGSLIPATRGPDTDGSLFPVIISPRKTLLLTTRPELQWSPVASSKPHAAVTYTVSIENYGGTVWSRNVTSGTKMDYPKDEKALARREEYKLVVRTGNRTSEEEGAADLGFTVVTEEEAKKIADAEAGVRALNLRSSETQFFIADLYAARGLSSEAIARLNELRMDIRQLAILRLLGDLYAAAGLHRQAVAYYEGALKLSQAASDLEGQALTLTSLGRSYKMLNKPDEAQARWTKAIAVFGKLGETVTIKELAEPSRK